MPRLRALPALALLTTIVSCTLLPGCASAAPPTKAKRAQAAAPFTLGFNDFDLASYSGFRGFPVNEAALNAGFANGRRAGASEWRVLVIWRRIARNATAAPQPASLAADPGWSGYVWDDLDRQIRGITAAGMQPIVWPIQAPDWAEGAGRPKVSDDAPVGTWRPSPDAYRQFGSAIARRYSGTYPDPANPGRALPRIATFQAWNEPNLATYLTPQWVRSGSTWKMESPALFRQLVNAFSAGVKAAQPSATVLAGATAPFGDFNPGDPRIMPAKFTRDLLCVREARGKATGRRSCGKLRIDGWAHHTYPIGPPWRTARNADDVVVPDMPKLTRLYDAAAKAGTLRRAAARNVWMTEMSWESAPDPNGLDLATHAAYMQGAFYLLWKAGVKHVLWWGSRDEAPGKDWNATYQSGVFTRGSDPTQDTAKPAFTAFRFPFAAFRVSGVARLWAKPPATGPITVQLESSPGTWTTVATLTASADGTASGRLRIGSGARLRAVQGTEISLPWTTT